MLGFGSAGLGIASLLKTAMMQAGLPEAEARSRFYPIGRSGLMLEGDPRADASQQPWVRRRPDVAGWELRKPDQIGLYDVVKNARPTVLIGTSGAAEAFSEEVVRAMAAGVERPAIFPLSNPTSRSEAVPQDLMDWTEGRAIVGTGSPFPPVQCGGRRMPVDQTNNSYIFPGMALGVIACNARRVTDVMAAARRLTELSPARREKAGRLLPPITELRSVSVHVAIAVARQAAAEEMAGRIEQNSLESTVLANVWEPEYRPYRVMARPVDLDDEVMVRKVESTMRWHGL